jgi:hypothetical protein
LMRRLILNRKNGEENVFVPVHLFSALKTSPLCPLQLKVTGHFSSRRPQAHLL